MVTGPETLPWIQLLGLMTEGPLPTLGGTIRVLEPADPRAIGWVGAPPVIGAAPSPGGDVLRVWCDGARYRQEATDGAPWLISGDRDCWSFRDGPDLPPVRLPASRLRHLGDARALVARRPLKEWFDDDFTRPTGPVRATTLLGRPAWEVELAPPARKPAPMQQVVDAETGLVLQQRIDALGMVVEWVDLVVGQPLDPALFGWTGPSRDGEELERARRAEWEREQTARSAAFARDVLALPLVVELAVGEVRVHDHDPATGAFEISLGDWIGVLARRAISEEPWDRDPSEVEHTWADERWEWALTLDDETLAPGGLARLQAQLGSMPR